MKTNQRNIKIVKWIARILALAILLFGLPFYFGYGNPLPFIDANYTIWDNLWLSVFPLMFIGLALGWWNEKVGGYLVTVPLAIALIVGTLIGEFVWFMAAPLIVGILYLVVGYKEKRRKK